MPAVPAILQRLSFASGGAVASGRIRLQTLLAIRWIAIAGQLTALLVVRFGLGFEFPFWEALAVVAASALMNLVLPLRHARQSHVGSRDATLYLGFDILQLGLLLYLTGGLGNPFELLILAPVVVSATILSPRSTTILVALAIAITTALAIWHQPLPGRPEPLDPLLLFAIWAATVIGIVFIAAYVGRVAEEQRRMRDALEAAQAALAREQQFSAVGALAAAAAHELGTPLATISVVAKELARDLPRDSDEAADAQLLLSQAERCRDILAELARRPPADSGEPYYRAPLSSLIEAAAAPHAREDVMVDVEARGEGTEPRAARTPELLHGLGNLLGNAQQFARRRVEVLLDWSQSRITITIRDDGPGFPPTLLGRLGEPYLSTRRGDDGHMGLGVFIAQTLLQRTGAIVTFGNVTGGGAKVVIEWPHGIFEDNNDVGRESESHERRRGAYATSR